MTKWITSYYRQKDKTWSQADFHSHNDFEIYLFYGGICRFLIRDRIYHLQPGDLIIMNGLTLHRAMPLPIEPYERSVLQFSPDWIRPVISSLEMPELFEPFYKLNNYLFRLKGDKSLEAIEDLLKNISQLVVANKQNLLSAGSSAFNTRSANGQIKLYLIQLLYQIYQLSQSRLIELSRPESEKERHVERIAEWMDHHYFEKISLDSISMQLSLSKYYISHVFKEVTGATVMEYLASCRLNHAKYLLEMHPEKSISEITMESGFESCAHFSRFFRSKLGITPTEYRKARNHALLANLV